MNQLAYDTRTTLREELKVIPGVAWVAAGAVLLCWLLVVIPLIVEHAERKPEGGPPASVLVGLLVFAGIVLAVWVVMVFYVNADAGRRQMNRLLWTLLVIFIPNAIGFIVYFLLRNPIGRPCAKCRLLIRPGFAFCPACGEATAPLCPACRHEVEHGWANCAYCGTKLAG